jgi:predicted  nucleic acid-binding Zn-ribbon protein
MAKKSSKTQTPEDKLRALYALQVIDSRIDKIRTVRGELPLEVEDLEDEIEGLTTRVETLTNGMNELETEISNRENEIKDAKEMIKKYEGQQSKVRNNREYDSLSKEIEFQQLEIELAEKRIKEFKAQIAGKKEVLEAATEKLENRKQDLEIKKSELDEIVAETEKEEEFLQAKSESAEKDIEQRLLRAYKRIRGAAKNGLAVVPIDREASGGSFIKIPPQVQLDIAARKRIIVDEHSGRILVDQVLAEEETEKVEKMIAKELKK